MAAPSLREAFQVGVSILNTVVDKVTGTILAITGDARAPVTDSSEAEWWQHIGFASRPSNPTPANTEAQGICGESLTQRRGDRDICYASRDIRGQMLSGNLGPGETIIYAGGKLGTSQGRLLMKDDGSVTLFTTDSNTATGNPVAFRISPTGGLEFTSQWGSMVLDQTGFHVKTKAGPRLDMGGITIPGVPSAVTGAFTGYANLTAPSVQLAGANVTLGMGPILNQAVAGFPSLLVGGGPAPLSLADLSASALFASNTVWVSQ